jgi:hypothetical protein
MTSTLTEDKRVAARDADHIFMRGGAPTEHEVLPEWLLVLAGRIFHIPIIPFHGTYPFASSADAEAHMRESAQLLF